MVLEFILHFWLWGCMMWVSSHSWGRTFSWIWWKLQNDERKQELEITKYKQRVYMSITKKGTRMGNIIQSTQKSHPWTMFGMSSTANRTMIMRYLVLFSPFTTNKPNSSPTIVTTTKPLVAVFYLHMDYSYHFAKPTQHTFSILSFSFFLSFSRAPCSH